MSRMDRYKDLHDESELESVNNKKSFSPRKERQQKEPVEPATEEQLSAPQTKQRKKTTFFHTSNSPEKEKKPKQKKSRKKHKGLRILGLLILLVFLFSGGMFAYGKYSAEHDTSLPKEELEKFNGVTSADKSNNILLLGSDSRGGETGRADTIMVIQLDGSGKKPKMISFMRDTFVTIPGVGDNKINAAYAFGGADLVRQTLLDNFGIDCKYYAKVDFQSFEKVIDSLFPNGVQIDAEKDMSSHLEVPIKKGPQKMNGLTLLQYTRFRMDEEGDFGRVRRQQQAMSAIFSQMKNPLTLINLPLASGKAIGYTSTNIPTTFLLKNSFSVLKGAGGIDRLSVPVENSWSYGNSDYAGSILVVDKEQNKQAIQTFLAN